jgi:hypothetical protein
VTCLLHLLLVEDLLQVRLLQVHLLQVLTGAPDRVLLLTGGQDKVLLGLDRVLLLIGDLSRVLVRIGGLDRVPLLIEDLEWVPQDLLVLNNTLHNNQDMDMGNHLPQDNAPQVIPPLNLDTRQTHPTDNHHHHNNKRTEECTRKIRKKVVSQSWDLLLVSAVDSSLG